MKRSFALILTVLATGACAERTTGEAAALHQAGKVREAAVAYRAAAKADPANLAAWDGAIELFCRELADVGECLSTLDLELDLIGKLDRHRDVLGEVLERRARARLDQGLVEAALSDVERGLRAAPDRPGLHVARARAYLATGDLQRATDAVTIARKVAPADGEVLRLVDELFPDPEGKDAPFGGAR